MRTIIAAALLLAGTSVVAADPCALGGFRPGQDATTIALDDRDRFTPAWPRAYKIDGGATYRVRTDTDAYRQYIVIVDGKVAKVVREYRPELAARVLLALEDRHGAPSGGRIDLPAAGIVWTDRECGHVIEAVSRPRSRVAALVRGAEGALAVVVSTAASAPVDLLD